MGCVAQIAANCWYITLNMQISIPQKVVVGDDLIYIEGLDRFLFA